MAGKALLSLSIDLCGSTEIKEAIISLSKGQSDYRENLYKDYLRLLFSVERTFYNLLSNDDRIRLDRLFLVKTIGDEFWYVYEVDEADDKALKQAATALMDAVAASFSKSRDINLFSRPVADFEEEDDMKDVKNAHFDPPLKGVLDLLTDVTELNVARFNYLHEQMLSIAQARTPSIEARNELSATFYNNLNLASTSLEPSKTKAITAIRTDYIGLDVDRFFRISKFCRPNILSIGQALMERLDVTIDDIPTYEHVPIKVWNQQVPTVAGTKLSQRNAIVELVRADQLKGIGSEYKIYHLFGLASLNQSTFISAAGQRDLMKPTRAFLAENGFFGIERCNLVGAA